MNTPVPIPVATFLATVVSALLGAVPAQSQVTTVDSAGVEVVTTSSAQARGASGVAVDPVPVLQIGAVSGSDAYLFSGVSGIAVSPDGATVVVDAGSSEVRFFDPEGELAARRGGSGAGPGEFQSPRLTNVASADSVAVYDSGTRRFTFYARDGVGSRTLSTPGLVGRIEGVSTSNATGLVVRANGLPPFGAEGPVELGLVVETLDLETGSTEPVMDASLVQVAVPSPGRPPSFELAPYSQIPPAAATESGVFVALPGESSLGHYAWDGVLRRILRIEEAAGPPADQEWSAALESRIAERMAAGNGPPGAVRRAFEALEPPQVVPAFRALVVDDRGWVWGQTYDESNAGSPTWLVFDQDGIGRGSVVMPDGLSVSSIAGDLVAGVWRDELGVEHVHLHRIEGRE